MSGPYGGYDGQEEYIPTPEELAALEQTAAPTVLFGIEITPLRLGVLIGAVGLLCVGIFSIVHLRPKLQEMQQVDADIQDKSRRLQTANQVIVSLTGIEDDIVRARQVNDAISNLLPTPDNVDTQLLELNRLVTQSNVQLKSFIPSPFQPAGEDVPVAIQPQLQQSSTQVIVDSTSYDQWIDLMGNIERLETLFKVSDLRISIDPDSRVQTTEFNLDAFVYDSSVPIVIPENTVNEGET
ncbi:hypothetical protein [Synechococcus sp. PCC 7336]|uniref:hypothetical protein n=1 Tax=Synechococcus sp. PCC 7336 TaxID=195250 RepID=UPI000348E273|nr:hypothetical protein [Synechococcus sp. PCC 7336]